MKLPNAVTSQCEYVDANGVRCEVRRIRLGRNGYCPTHQQQHDHAELANNTPNQNRKK